MPGAQPRRWPRSATTGRIRLRYRAQQSPGVLVFRIAEDLLTVALLNNGTGKHDRHLVGEVFDHRKIVGNK